VHSQVRRGIAEGLSRDEHRHVAFLAMTTLGFPNAVAALTWIEDIVEEGGKPSRMTRVPRCPVGQQPSRSGRVGEQLAHP
jgi:hypothetical protein